MQVMKRERKRTCQHRRQGWGINGPTRGLHRKRGGRLIIAIRNNNDDMGISRTEITRKQKREEKQDYGSFKRRTSDISHEKTWTWQRKRKTESLLIAAQNNAVRTNHIKARIDKTQQNSRCSLCSDRDETINHIISECSKLAQKNIRLGTTGWARLSTGNCARNWSLTIRTNGICPTQNLSWRMRSTNFSRILRYKQIT